jgi:hypothetical protein
VAASRRRGSDLNATIKYPRRTTAPQLTTDGRYGQASATHNERRCGQRPGATIKYLRRTASAAAGNGLSTTINEHSSAMHNERRRGAAGNGLGTTPNYLRGAAGNSRARRSITFDAQQAPPRETLRAPR